MLLTSVIALGLVGDETLSLKTDVEEKVATIGVVLMVAGVICFLYS